MAQSKLFTESEVADIMRRAAELQEAGAEDGYVPGVTSDELVRIAKEAGIDPKFLEQALQQHRQPAGPVKKSASTEIERVYPVQIDPNDFDLLTDYVKVMPVSQNPKTGTVSGGMSQVGRSLQGTASAGWTNPTFKVTSREGRTKLTVNGDPSIAVVMSILWVIPMMIGIGVGKALTPLIGVLFALACVAMAVLTYRGIAKKAVAATEMTADKLEKAILENGTDVRKNLERASAPQTEATGEQEIAIG